MRGKEYAEVGGAARWAALTELLGKAAAPISSMALARILTPEAFGLAAGAAMVTSLAAVLADAGFQKHIVQRGLTGGEADARALGVALTASGTLAALLWLLIAAFAGPIARALGLPGRGAEVAAASLALIPSALGGVLGAVYRSRLDFRTLFVARCAQLATPFAVTIPAALLIRSHWALIAGSVCASAVDALVLAACAAWRPRPAFDARLLRRMLRESLWNWADGLLTWLTAWGDTLIVGLTLTAHDVGLYRASMRAVNAVLAIVAGAATGVLTSALARLRSDRAGFEDMLLAFQRRTAALLFPMGVGIFLYRDVVTAILLGEAWMEAAGFVGLWGLMSALAVPINTFGSCACIAGGRPRLSALAQIVQLGTMLPVTLLAGRRGFAALTTWRTLMRVQGMCVYLIILRRCFGLSPRRMLGAMAAPALCAGLMGALGAGLRVVSGGMAWSLAGMALCAAAYGAAMLAFPAGRRALLGGAEGKKPGVQRSPADRGKDG